MFTDEPLVEGKSSGSDNEKIEYYENFSLVKFNFFFF